MVDGGPGRYEDDDEVKSKPVMLELQNHRLKNDAHSVLDWKAREVRPYNGGDQELYWRMRPRKSLPIIEDLKMQHLTKALINPNVIAKLHDRGSDMTTKQWLSSNYSVEGKGDKIRADNDRSAGAFVLDYSLAKGPWEAMDAVQNYTMAMRLVRRDDWTGDLMQRILHEYRVFAHPTFSLDN